MDADQQPVVRALIGYLSPPWGLMTVPRMVTLEEAVDFARVGFAVLVDPQDLEDLTRWEQKQRALVTKPTRKWFERD